MVHWFVRPSVSHLFLIGGHPIGLAASAEPVLAQSWRQFDFGGRTGLNNKVTDRIRISGKDLGVLAVNSFCPRCFWVSRKAPAGLPYQIFPGIFSSIDSYTKKVVHGWFDRKSTAPVWLTELGPITGYIEPPHHSKFQFVDEETNILLTGAPDAIFVRGDRTHLIGDYKTSRFTKNQDSLLPMYEVQLNAYALIAEAVGISPVSAIALIYAEPLTDQSAADLEANHDEAGFSMGFAAKIKQLVLNTEMVHPLLGRAREILDLQVAPSGRRGCKECEKLDGLIALIENDAQSP